MKPKGIDYFLNISSNSHMLIKRLALFIVMTVLPLGLENGRAAVITGQEPVIVTIGSGTNVSYLALDETSLSTVPIVYAWHYDGLTNAFGTAWSGTDLLQGIIAGSSSTPFALNVTTGAYGLVASFSIGSNTATIDPLGSPVWTYWIKGGEEYVPYGDNGDFTFLPSPLNWVVSPANYDTRWITNGSWDAWTLSPFSYTGAPSDTSYYTDTNGIVQPVTFGTYGGVAPLSAVPEPSASVCTLMALLLVVAIRYGNSKRRCGA
jgi:hypothetical protein